MTEADRKTGPSPYLLHLPQGEGSPLFLDSPHSATSYPVDFRPAAGLPLPLLRQAEDTFVDELYADAPARGIALLCAGFPRSFLDANRGIEEIDEALLDAPWPGPRQDTSKVRLGKGLVWRVLDTGEAIYDRKLSVAEVQQRIAHYYLPYYAQLQKLAEHAIAAHGSAWHINCHSMPSQAAQYATEHPGLQHPDFVVGDRDGTTCDTRFTDRVEGVLKEMGYDVWRNHPYKGVEIVRVVGQPAQHRHSLQLEINRKLYMDEVGLAHNAGFGKLKADLNALLDDLKAFVKTA
ncbi:N-formylglutamate amidohydrolase [Cupriavidus basilensis]|uniref:N-formylglutamate amidohydrolase n=1 Tax=Cupriavidus basilensis TaxID=68895 RepID=A0ABT6ASY5_9BURK|nr:N-formylglutamate amidohydrolase [Cupriavidus basilensis]MDF3835739.1 N-formylglutamate amidohydrolase [Cupriavidus basilensis]